MSFNFRLKKNQAVLAATATGAVAVATTLTGNAIAMKGVANGTCIAAQFDLVVTTSSLTLAPSLQGSVDGGTTWQSLFTMNSAANVATAGGTGSSVATSRTILSPAAPLPFTHLRGVVVTAGATAGATVDTYAVRYHYLGADFTT